MRQGEEEGTALVEPMCSDENEMKVPNRVEVEL